MTAPMQYREMPPGPGLSKVAACYWEFTVTGALPPGFLHRIPVDGCASIGYARSARGAVMIFVGPRLKSLSVPVAEGDRIWGVRFLPGASAAVLGKTGAEWRDQSGLLDHPLCTGLLDELRSATTFEDAAAIYEAVIQPAEPCSVTAVAVQATLESRGLAKVGELAELAGMSERQLLRIFRREVGLTPKQFARICRLRAAAIDSLAGQANWGEIAAQRGYFDQSHLVRDFNALFGITPGEFEESLARQIDHVSLVY